MIKLDMASARIAGVVVLTLLCFAMPCIAMPAFSAVQQNGAPLGGCSHHQPAQNMPAPGQHECCAYHSAARPAAIYRGGTLDCTGAAMIEPRGITAAATPVTHVSLRLLPAQLSVPLRI